MVRIVKTGEVNFLVRHWRPKFCISNVIEEKAWNTGRFIIYLPGPKARDKFEAWITEKLGIFLNTVKLESVEENSLVLFRSLEYVYWNETDRENFLRELWSQSYFLKSSGKVIKRYGQNNY